MKSYYSQRTGLDLFIWRRFPCSSSQEAEEGHTDFIRSLTSREGGSKCLQLSLACLGSVQGGEAWGVLYAACLSGAGWREKSSSYQLEGLGPFWTGQGVSVHRPHTSRVIVQSVKPGAGLWQRKRTLRSGSSPRGGTTQSRSSGFLVEGQRSPVV